MQGYRRSLDAKARVNTFTVRRNMTEDIQEGIWSLTRSHVNTRNNRLNVRMRDRNRLCRSSGPCLSSFHDGNGKKDQLCYDVTFEFLSIQNPNKGRAKVVKSQSPQITQARRALPERARNTIETWQTSPSPTPPEASLPR